MLSERTLKIFSTSTLQSTFLLQQESSDFWNFNRRYLDPIITAKHYLSTGPAFDSKNEGINVVVCWLTAKYIHCTNFSEYRLFEMIGMFVKSKYRVRSLF